MTEIVVTGIGAVSPAGWGVGPLRDALAAGHPLPLDSMPRPGWNRAVPMRRVPPATTRAAVLSHPRLRRSSPISQFATAAAVEALGAGPSMLPKLEADRLGLIYCTMAGSVAYSRRFYEETFRDPAMASPILFPETVFNAPASHLAALLGVEGRIHTEIGDQTCVLKAFDTAALWLNSGLIDRALVVAAEEADWLTADALSVVARHGVCAEGAGALLLARATGGPGEKRLATIAAVADPGLYAAGQRPSVAIRMVREQLAEYVRAEGLLVDSTGGRGRLDRIEQQVWRDWPGARLAPKCVLGEGWAASAAWQCVAALDHIFRGAAPYAFVSVAGAIEQAIGVIFRGTQSPARS